MPLYSSSQLAELMKAYKTLGIETNASAGEIKKVYRQLAKKWHPDKHSLDTQNSATNRMQEINLAYKKIRHAPLRYSGSSLGNETDLQFENWGHKKKQYRAAPTYLNNQLEAILRFIGGAAIGFLLSFFMFASRFPGAFIYFTFLPFVCGILSLRFGDDFWLGVWELFTE